jgi:hypothetical protein
MKVVHAVWFHLYGDEPCIYGIYSTVDKAREVLERIVQQCDGKTTSYDTAETWRGRVAIREHIMDGD